MGCASTSIPPSGMPSPCARREGARTARRRNGPASCLYSGTPRLARGRGKEHSMPSARCNGINLHYEIEGNGYPVILIQGLGGDGASWALQRDALAPSFQVVTF